VKLARTGSRILLWRALQKAAGALAMLIVAHGLGPQGNGRFSLTILLVTVAAAVLSGGAGLASVPILRQARVAAIRVFHAQAAWLATVFLALCVLSWLVWGGPIGRWLQSSLEWNLPLLAAALAGVFALLVFETANYDLLACGDVVAGTRVGAWRALAHLLVVALLLTAGTLELDKAIWSMVLVYLGAGLWLGRRAKTAIKLLATPAASTLIGSPRLALQLVHRGWLGQLSALSYLLMLRLDQLFLESFLDVSAVGLYAMAAWGAELLWLVPEALNPLLVYSSADDRDQGRDLMAARAVRLGLWTTAVAAIPLAMMAPLLLGLLRGGAYLPAVPALWVLLPGIVAFAPGAILAGDFIGRGRPHWNTQASGITVAVNVALCLLWIPRLGILGAALSSTVAYTLGSCLMLGRFQRLTGVAWRLLLLPRASDLRR
jgi:O-antigen/teichoic acid export membrane protein